MKTYTTMEKSMNTRTFKVLLSGTAAFLAATLFLGGCKTEDDYKKERIARAEEQFQSIRKRTVPSDKMLTLEDCIKLSREYNMELRIRNAEQDAAKGMMWAEILGMLPDLGITENFTARSNQNGSRSKAVASDGETYGYSTSQDKRINNLTVDAAFSLLDFGLAFFNSQQSYDRMLLKQRQEQRFRQNLTLDVVRAYFKVASAQRAQDITANLLRQCKDRSAMIEKLRKQKKITAFRAYEELNRYMIMSKRLTNYTRLHENACVELRSLIGVYPSANIIVDDSILDKLPGMDFPDIELLEQMAILKRPELYEIDIQKHINILECRKTLVMMMPNVQLYMSMVNNSNSFLYHQTWWEMAVRAAYNVLKTPQHLARYMAYSDQADVEELRSAAQAITVMSQVRMAKADIVSTRERYELNRREFRNYSEHLKKAEAIKRVQGSLSQLELDHLRLTTAETEIERLLSLGACHVAYYRLLNAIGVDNLSPDSQKAMKEELARGAERAREELARARAEYEAKLHQAEEARIARILFDDGIRYYAEKKVVHAAEYFRRAAEKGNASGMFCLGKLYWSGKGVEQNRMKAMEYFRKAAECGNVEANVTLGWIYYNGENGVAQKDLARAGAYYKKASDEGDDKATYWLADILFRQEKYDQAMVCYKKAARVGDLSAMVRVGCMYRDGLTAEGKKYGKAMEWFKRAADLGDASAMSNISMMYEAGDGVPRSTKLAQEWYKRFEEASAK